MKKIYFGGTREDAERIGFDDKFIYDVIKGTTKKKQVKIVCIDREECLVPFNEWMKKSNKVSY